MSKHQYDCLFRQVVSWEGGCCPWAYLTLRKETLEKLSVRLGVSESTITYWARKKRSGEISCERAANCLINKLP